MQKRPMAFLAAGAALLAAAGCTLSELGDAAIYNPNFEAPIEVFMDPRAPSISQQFRVSNKPVSDGGVSTMHEGIDVIARAGTPIIAAGAGTVSSSLFEPAYGHRVVIDHGVDATGRRTSTVYMHLAKRLATPGQRVERGEQIGTMGRTGFLAGGISHLHFEVHREIKGHGIMVQDPHKFWALGVGRVTCFDPNIPLESTAFRITYPVPCRGIELAGIGQ
ncbi:M23 family metallopeptidase [Oricola sp.]|uniref:M23 family metallopeptidase n=1 Tax=Oricola sp. TaxID=1979950 RepID=UPI003BAC7BA9